MSDMQVLKMPAFRFWTMNAQICRVRAEEDLRSARIARLVQGDKEAIEELNKGLQEELQDPIQVRDVEIMSTSRDQHEKLKLLQG